MTHAAAHGRGFTLIEIAMALIILGLIFGRGLSLLSSQMEQQRIRDTQRVLDEAREALLGYAANQTPPHLPCPDMTVAAATGTANDGLEDVTAATGHCVTQEGNLPWATLAVGGADAWGNRIRYSVNGIFSSRSPAASFSLSSVATLRVCSSASCASVLASGVPAVVLSQGVNGFGAVTGNHERRGRAEADHGYHKFNGCDALIADAGYGRPDGAIGRRRSDADERVAGC